MPACPVCECNDSQLLVTTIKKVSAHRCQQFDTYYCTHWQWGTGINITQHGP